MENSASFVVISAVEFERRLFGGVGARGPTCGGNAEHCGSI